MYLLFQMKKEVLIQASECRNTEGSPRKYPEDECRAQPSWWDRTHRRGRLGGSVRLALGSWLFTNIPSSMEDRGNLGAYFRTTP